MADLDFSGKIAAVDPEGGWKKYPEYSSILAGLDDTAFAVSYLQEQR
jgi:hypothetical protein